jgi:hypothetical protein
MINNSTVQWIIYNSRIDLAGDNPQKQNGACSKGKQRQRGEPAVQYKESTTAEGSQQYS